MESAPFSPQEIRALLREFRDARYALRDADGSEHTRLLVRACALEAFAGFRGYTLTYGYETGSAHLYHTGRDERYILTIYGEYSHE